VSGPLLLFGDDGSPGADVAWLWVNEQRWPGWRVAVLHADTPPIGPPPGAEAARPRPWNPPDPRVAFGDAAFADVVHLRAVADPRVALLETPADLVVIGSRGHGLVKALHLGSTAEYLLHGPVAPLVVVRHAAAVRRVLVATDGSRHARRAMETLAALPWRAGLEAVIAVSVEDGRTDTAAALSEAAAVLGGAGLDTRALPRTRTVAAAILGAAARVGASLIVLGTRGLGGLRRLTLGSAASAVARSAPGAVLVARALDTDRP
jgi:nucleotide-binding universal stress UspA family protein